MPGFVKKQLKEKRSRLEPRALQERMTMAISASYHGGKLVVHFPFDTQFIGKLKQSVPAWARAYDPSSKSWTIESAYTSDTIEMLEEYFGEVSVSGRPAVRSRSVIADEDHQELHVLDSAPAEVVHAAYRALSKIHHPDKGGDPSLMQRINSAFARIDARLQGGERV